MCTEDIKDLLVGYLYDELNDAERRSFDTHLTACAACRAELAGLRATRDDLLAWSPPECRDLPSSWAVEPATPVGMRLRAWAPAFGLAAAAMLLLAVSAAVANVEIRYGSDGLVVRTGHTAAPAAAVEAPALEAVPARASYVTAEELAAFEARLRDALAPAPAAIRPVSNTADTTQLSSDVRRLIEESEERTRQEMAARFIDFVRDVEGHRRADMMRVQQALGQIQRTNGAEAAQTRDIVNRLMLVSQGQER